MKVGPSSTGLTDDERNQYINRMSDTYGSSAAERIIPGDGDMILDSQPFEPTELVWDNTGPLEVTDSSDTTIMRSDNYAALYETNVENDDDYYLYWLWSGARPRKASDWTGEIRGLWSHIDLTNGGDITTYAPGSDMKDNGTVGPHPDKTGQDTDEFAVQWQGERAETQIVTGSCTEKRSDAERGFEWNISLAGGKR